MSGKKQVYRLFKVAKELNVGTSLLVDHLQANGHDVSPSPNTKLSSEQYDILLKEFASEKLIKERADQLAEQRREELGHPADEPEETNHVEAEDKEDEITAASLRDQIKQSSSAGTTPSEAAPNKPAKEEKKEPTPPQETPAPEPPQQQPKPEEKEAPAPEPEPEVKPEKETVETPVAEQEEEPAMVEEVVEEVAEEVVEDDAQKGKSSGLNIVGRVDLDKFKKKPGGRNKDRGSGKERAKPRREAATQKPESKPRPEAKPKPQTQQAPAAEDKGGDTPPANLPTEKPVDQPKTTDPAIAAQAKETPSAEGKEQTGETEGGSVYRAEDRTPKLSGLKVMGKIELPGDKRKKKDDGSGDKDADGDDANKKKRRRRRRKRNRKSTDTPGTDSSGSDNRGGAARGKKEKPSAKEVDQSIRETLSQIGRSPSRNRQRLRREKRDMAEKRREALEAQAAEDAQTLELTEFITANEFASMIKVPVTEIITKSFELGMMVSINQRLDAELLTLLAGDYGYNVKFVDITEGGLEIEEDDDDPDKLISRYPIITVMGHVDHGKTTLLDRLRKENVAAGEAGGITQHIGAYVVELSSGHRVTFLDTPGHEAFTAMRARGAKVTDLVIVVIAADDAVMPQTKEAISHAQAAEVPMIFAFNKIDKPGADAERIKGQLAEMNLLVEDWGGKYQSQEISALKGQHVEELLEKVIFEADLQELKADPDRMAVGTVIEARLDKGRGNVATVLVQKGTLRVGDDLVAGIHYGRVRALIDQNGERVKEAGPSTPVQVLGINGQPTAGDKFYVFEDDGRAKEISQKRTELYREQQMRNTNRLTLEEIGRRRALGNFRELNVIIRGDVDGSVEALAGALLKLSTEEVQVNILQKGVGAITEADINLAIASEAVVLAFNVRPIAKARQLAERENVDISFYSVIYDAIDDVRDALEGLLSPELREEEAGTAEIKEVFSITKVGNIAGCLVTSGKIERANPIRIIRDGVVIHEGKLSSLKRFKDDAKEVFSGQECGMMIDNFNDIAEGDIIESFRVNEVRRKLKS